MSYFKILIIFNIGYVYYFQLPYNTIFNLENLPVYDFILELRICMGSGSVSLAAYAAKTKAKAHNWSSCFLADDKTSYSPSLSHFCWLSPS